MIEKVFHLLYDTIIIVILQTKEHIEIYLEIYYKEQLKNSESKTFTLNENFKEKLLYDYLDNFLKETPYTYIVYLDQNFPQGAIPTCQKEQQKYYLHLEDVKTLCFKNKWGVYTLEANLYQEQKRYQNLQADFIFSPFIVLYEFYKDKIQDTNTALYILILEDYIALAVFQYDQLLFAQYIDTIPQQEQSLSLDHEEESIATNEEDLLEEIDDSINLDEIDLDDDLEELGDGLEDLDSLDNLESLDSLDDLNDENVDLEQQLEDNFEEISQDEEPEEEKLDQNPIQTTQDFYRFEMVQEALKEFYNNDLYESDFIEHIYVADTVGVSKDFKKFFQEELFAQVIVRKIDLSLELLNLAKKEIFQ